MRCYHKRPSVWVDVTTPACTVCGHTLSARQVTEWLDTLPESAPERRQIVKATTTRIGQRDR